MSYPNADTLPPLQDKFAAARAEVTAARRSLPQLRDLMASAKISANAIVHTLAQNLKSAREALIAARDAAGMEGFVQDQLNDPTFDLAAETNAIVTVIDNVMAWIAANVPTDGNGWALLWKVEADMSITTRSFTPAQTTGLRTQLDNLITALG